MVHEEVMAMVEEMGCPFAYGHFAEGQSPEPPFLVFLYPKSRNFAADGIAYHKGSRLQIELYTEYKSLETEKKVESILDNRKIFYTKSEVWIESEQLYEVLYEMEV